MRLLKCDENGVWCDETAFISQVPYPATGETVTGYLSVNPLVIR